MGLNTLLDDLILNRSPHVRLYNDIKAFTCSAHKYGYSIQRRLSFYLICQTRCCPKELYNSGASHFRVLKADTRVAGVSPKVTAQVFYNIGRIDMTGVINGIDVENEQRAFLLC